LPSSTSIVNLSCFRVLMVSFMVEGAFVKEVLKDSRRAQDVDGSLVLNALLWIIFIVSLGTSVNPPSAPLFKNLPCLQSLHSPPTWKPRPRRALGCLAVHRCLFEQRERNITQTFNIHYSKKIWFSRVTE
jgi:hypothetical protein